MHIQEHTLATALNMLFNAFPSDENLDTQLSTSVVWPHPFTVVVVGLQIREPVSILTTARPAAPHYQILVQKRNIVRLTVARQGYDIPSPTMSP
jgi:hypothetical protein